MTIEGMDVSHWSGKVDYSIAKKAGMFFSIFKATDFDPITKTGFVDTQAAANWTNTRAQQIINGSYHWLQPRIDPIAQANFYVKFWEKYPGDLAPILDFEDKDIVSPTDMLYKAQAWLEAVEQATQRTPIVYTSSGYMRQFEQSKAGFLQRSPLWLAQYPLCPIPSIPNPWPPWTIWQYSQTAPGPACGAQSAGMDMNRFKGSLDELKALTPTYSGTSTTETPPVVVPAATKPLRARVIVGNLNIRSGPGISYPVTSRLTAGDLVDVQAIAGAAWLQIAPGCYAAYCSNETKYMELIQ
jgi:lysozyme